MIPGKTRIRGSILKNDGTPEQVEGTFVLRTDEPGEHIQDIVIKTDDGRVVYIDEQEAREIN
jgi:hypothetical protein